MPRQGPLVLTGQLGDVMKESAQAALSFVALAARSGSGIEENFLEKTDIHVHIPAGAIPKDGPSAGVTMFMALVSLLTGKPVRQRRGDDRRDHAARATCCRSAASRRRSWRRTAPASSGSSCPERNRKDLIDVPEQARNEMEIFFVKRMDELLPLALTEMPKLGVMTPPTLQAPPAPPAA